MPIYRIARTLKTGWRFRLDYCPHDTEYDPNGTITSVGDVAILELGDHVAEFDSIPYGLQQPATLSLKLLYTQLPAAMVAYLRDGYNTANDRQQNIWVLWTDRGTNGATWTLEFVGCEDNTEGVDYSPEAGSEYSYDAELVDICYHAMKSATGYDALNAIKPPNHLSPTGWFAPYYKLWHWYKGVPLTGAGVEARADNQYQDAQGLRVGMYTAEGVLRHVLFGLAQYLTDNYTRSAALDSALGSSITADLALDQFGRSEFTELVNRSCEWLSYQYSGATRQPGTARTKSNTFLCARVQPPTQLGGQGSEYFGGVLGVSDEYGWARRDTSLYDVMRDLCETFAVKVTYKPRWEPAGTFYKGLSYEFTVRRIGTPITASDTGATTWDARLGTNGFIDRPKIGRRQDNISKAETRWASKSDEDAKEIVRLQAGAAGSRSMNIEPIVHNCPTWLPEWNDEDGRYGPLLQTNLLYWREGESAHKMHENTRIRFMPGAAGAYVESTTTAGEDPVTFRDGENDGNYRIQLNAIQAGACLPNALAKLHLHLWTNPDNAVVETSWALSRTTEAMTDKLGAVHNLAFAEDGGAGGTSPYATTFDRLPWVRAVLTSTSVNYDTGLCTVKYFLIAETGNLT